VKIFVGSTNPVKINAVTTAASETWPDVTVTGIDVPSGIPEQPIGDEQTRQGAINRAQAVLAAGQKANQSDVTLLGVGLEGGVMDINGELFSTVWTTVIDEDGQLFEANGARFKVPEIVAEKILAGEEMGPIMSQLLGEADIRKKQGMIGVITSGFIDRTEEYSSIVKMALGLWYGRDWQQLVANSI